MSAPINITRQRSSSVTSTSSSASTNSFLTLTADSRVSYSPTNSDVQHSFLELTPPLSTAGRNSFLGNVEVKKEKKGLVSLNNADGDRRLFLMRARDN